MTLPPSFPAPAPLPDGAVRIDAGDAVWLLERSPDAAMLTDCAGVIGYVNPAFEQLTGYARGEALGRTPALLKSGRQSGRFYAELWRRLCAGQEFHGVLVNRRRDGSLFHEEKSIRPLFDAHGRIVHYMACGRDVSEREQALERLRHEAAHDALTGAVPRALYLDRLQQACAQALRSGGRFAVLVVNLDRFKDINAGFGHAAGDAALRGCAQRLQQCVRQTDTVARLGGDEFALLLRDAHDADRVLRSAVAACSAPLPREDGPALALSVSVGASFFPEDGSDAAGLLHCADQALSRAKAAGGGRWCRSDRALPLPAPRADAVGTGLCHPELRPLLELVPVRRRRLHAGEPVYRAGERFRQVHLLHAGHCKLMALSPDGREELAALLFKGDWLGFDGLADERHSCSAIATDTCEVWTLPYEQLLHAGAQRPQLLGHVHAALARQWAREREGVLAQHALPADAKVADFLGRWAAGLEHGGLCSDRVALPVSRGEISGHLGLRLESVSRAITRLEKAGLIHFGEHSRRALHVPDLAALRAFVREAAEHAA